MSDGRNEREKNYYLYFHGLSSNLLLHLSQHFYNDIRCRTYHDGSIKRVFRIDNRRENIIIQRENTALYVFACRFFFSLLFTTPRVVQYIFVHYIVSIVPDRWCFTVHVVFFWSYDIIFLWKKKKYYSRHNFLDFILRKKFFFFLWKIFFR